MHIAHAAPAAPVSPASAEDLEQPEDETPAAPETEGRPGDSRPGVITFSMIKEPPSGGSFVTTAEIFLLYFIGIHKFFRRFHLTLPSAYAIISNCAGFAREICYAMTGGEHLCPESWLPEIEWWG